MSKPTSFFVDSQAAGDRQSTKNANAPVSAPGAWVLAVGLGGLAFVLAAVALEVLSGQYANSAVPAWADDAVPLAWPAPLRVLWWLSVAAAAGGFRWSLHRIGLRPNPVVTVLTVGPFVVFAAGIAAGADWATWH
ncbi:MAG: hypothetical protein ACRD0G_11755 [Acidimicrobiales bacterium]